MCRFKVIGVDGNSVRVAYGALSFDVIMLVKRDGGYFVDKPKSLYIAQPDFDEFIQSVIDYYTKVAH